MPPVIENILSDNAAEQSSTSVLSAISDKSAEIRCDIESSLRLFQELRFGMFIHWGLYAIPGGRWEGVDVPWVAEWIMRKMKIPRDEYSRLAENFNPTEFNAREWVNIARKAGMKYIVITAKHHDGFAMFRSAVSPYNIVDATPFKRDPLAELSEECRKADIKLGFYYSQDQDWHEPGGSGNDWDFPGKQTGEFTRYIETKVKPQLRELLTNYGPVFLIWFDTPYSIKMEQSQELKDFVHSLQPQCLVSGRVGHSLGDYHSLADNQVPEEQLEGTCEGLGTVNDSWGFKFNDRQWKTTAQLLGIMGRLFSRGANYLLNVGPDALGKIPADCCERLLGLGDWVRQNREAVYGTGASPWGYSFPWGSITAVGNAVYLWVFELEQPDLLLYGLRNLIRRVSFLHLQLPDLEFKEEHLPELDYHKLVIIVPLDALDKPATVIKIEMEGAIDLNDKSYSAETF